MTKDQVANVFYHFCTRFSSAVGLDGIYQTDNYLKNTKVERIKSEYLLEARTDVCLQHKLSNLFLNGLLIL